VHQQAEIRDIN